VESRRRAKRRVERRYAKIASEGLPSDLVRSEPANRLRLMGYSNQEIASVPESSLVGLGCENPGTPYTFPAYLKGIPHTALTTNSGDAILISVF